jgi:hypothetical protein
MLTCDGIGGFDSVNSTLVCTGTDARTSHLHNRLLFVYRLAFASASGATMTAA